MDMKNSVGAKCLSACVALAFLLSIPSQAWSQKIQITGGAKLTTNQGTYLVLTSDSSLIHIQNQGQLTANYLTLNGDIVNDSDSLGYIDTLIISGTDSHGLYGNSDTLSVGSLILGTDLTDEVNLGIHDSLSLEGGIITVGVDRGVYIPISSIGGATDSTYIEGKLYLQTLPQSSEQTLIYPLGDDGTYRPISILLSQTNMESVYYWAEFSQGEPSLATTPASVSDLSKAGYYQLGAETANVSQAEITIPMDGLDSLDCLDMTQVLWAAESEWAEVGGNGLSSPEDVTTDVLTSVDGYYTLGSVDDVPYTFANGQDAGVVIGQDDLYSDGSATTVDGLSDPRGVAIDATNGKAYVCDRSNNRILRYSLPMVSGHDAELVYGQTDFTSSGIDSTSTTLHQPIGIEVDSDGNLWVADAKNNRVLRYDDAYLDNANGAAADLVLGQTGFGTAAESTTAIGLAVPRDMHVDSDGTLWIADYKNNRVLRYDDAASLTSGASADGVLGQADFTSNTGGTTASTMEGASGISSRHGTLWVADMRNNRVLRFSEASSKADGDDADGVLGQADFESGVVSDYRWWAENRLLL